MMSTHKQTVTGESKMSRDAVAHLFDAALEIATPEQGYATDKAQDAQNAAFDAASANGWDWEGDRWFVDWCLKATDLEIIVEGKKRFLKATAK